MFKTLFLKKKRKYLDKLLIEEEYADRFGPLTWDEVLEFKIRKIFIIPMLSFFDTIFVFIQIKQF